MSPQPIYRSDAIRSPAYQLRYDWTGWPSDGAFPADPPEGAIDALSAKLESDGIRVLEVDWAPTEVHLTVSTEPAVAPVTVADRVKGRLQHELRSSGHGSAFRRKFGLRAVGRARREDVESYIDEQVDREQLADSEYEALVERYTTRSDTVSLEEPDRSGSGSFWYNLHVVFAAHGRHRARTRERLQTIHDWMWKVAASKGHQLSAVSVMPDHVHAAVRPGYEEAPEEVALAYMNNTAYALGQRRVWEDSFYVGTFGEYDMDAIR